MNNDRAEQLQFLRFLAFSLIFLWHSDRWTPYWFPKGNGAACAVSFFIILSGLVKAYSSYPKHNKFTVKITIDNVIRKIKKVYPLYFVTTLIAFSYSKIPLYIAENGYMDIGSRHLLMRHLLLLQSWKQYGYFEFNGVSWFLSTIMFLYVLETPIIYIATNIKYWKNNILYFFIIFFLSIGVSYWYSFSLRNENMEFWLYVFPPARICEFVSGICLGYIVRLIKDKNIFNNKILYTLFELISLIFWFYMMYVPYAEWKFRIVHWILPNCLLLFIFAFGKGYLSKLFCFYPCKRLGDISFECFLLHKVIIMIYSITSGVKNISITGNVLSIILCMSITLLIANGISNKKTIKDS